MDSPNSAKERLLTQGRRLFWARGYSNVSVRQISTAAKADIALISRYFGGKRGLFEASLVGAFDVFDNPPADAQALVDELVDIFVEAPRDGANPSPLQMLLTNANDDEVGTFVRDRFDTLFQHPLSAIVGSEPKAALLISVVLGFSVAEKSLMMRGISAPGTPAYEAQLRHLLTAALTAPGAT